MRSEPEAVEVESLEIATSRRLNVVVRSPLYPRSGSKWRDNYP